MTDAISTPATFGCNPGDSDFTIEFFGRPVPRLTSPAAWLHIPIERGGDVRTITHSQETHDGVLFHATRIYGADARLESVQLTRADLVRGQVVGRKLRGGV